MQFRRRPLLPALVALALCVGAFVVSRPGARDRGVASAEARGEGESARVELAAANALAVERRERAPDVAESTAASLAQTPRGELRFLSALDRRPVAGKWFARGARDDSGPLALESDASGSARLPVGTWNLECRDTKWCVAADAFALTADEPRTVWVQRRGSLAFQLADPSGRAIADVRAEWFPYRGGEADAFASSTEALRAPTLTARSNSSGALTFGDCPIDSGVAVFVHPDFARRTYWVSSEQPRTIELTLEPSHRPPRVVAFVRCGDGEPLTSVSVRSTVGSLLASDAATPSTVAIPAWVDAHEALVVESPTCFRSDFKLADVGERVAVHGVTQLRLRVTSSASIEASVRMSAWCPREDPACATPNFAPSKSVRTNEEFLIACPADTTLVLRARGADGSFAERTIEVGRDECRVDLPLGSGSDTWTAHVVGETGEPLPEAWARTPQESGGSVRVRADASGRLVVPLAAETSIVEVGATGYVPVRVARALGEDVSSVHAEIVLRRARRFCVRTIGPDGAPLAGLGLRLWPGVGASADDVRASSAWSAVPRRASLQTTDADGRAWFDGVAGGKAKLDVLLPAIHRSDAFEETLLLQSSELDSSAEQDEYVVTVAAPKRICLRVREASSSLPVESFRLRSRDGAFDLEVEGDAWCGWISSRFETLTVEVPQVGRADFDVAGASADEVAIVRVVPTVLSEVVVTGAASASLNGAAVFHLFRREASGLYSLGSVSVPMEAGRSKLCLPFDRNGGDVELALAEVAGVALAGRCRPATVVWELDAVLEFRLDETP
ncbi:MAG: hypothetical protein K8S98_09350 [Planctomycetes bacterium]|nr:hypothetical protein [Planctomycetota bacterium]